MKVETVNLVNKQGVPVFVDADKKDFYIENYGMTDPAAIAAKRGRPAKKTEEPE